MCKVVYNDGKNCNDFNDHHNPKCFKKKKSVYKVPLSVVICVGRQRNCSRPSHLATSSSESARAELATHSRTGEYFCRIEGAFFHPHTQSSGSKSCWAYSFSLALPPQCRQTLQTFHDWCTGGWSVHDSRGEQASPEPAGPGGIPSQDPYHALQSGPDCCLWTGEERTHR